MNNYSATPMNTGGADDPWATASPATPAPVASNNGFATAANAGMGSSMNDAPSQPADNGGGYGGGGGQGSGYAGYGSVGGYGSAVAARQAAGGVSAPGAVATSTPPPSPGPDYTWNPIIGAFLYTPGGKADMGAIDNSPYSTTNNGLGQNLKQGLPFNAYTDASINNQRDAYVSANPNISANDLYALTRASQAMTQAVSVGALSNQQASAALQSMMQSVTPKPPAQAAPVIGSAAANARAGGSGGGTSGGGASGSGGVASFDDYNNPSSSMYSTLQIGAGGRPFSTTPTPRLNSGLITPPNTGDAGLAQQYQIQAGDTLGSIAARYGTTVEALAAANGIANPNLIVAGQTLSIPGAAAAGITPPGAPRPNITPPGATGVGPGGRTVDQIRGTDYLSPDERAWYLSQTGGNPGTSTPGGPASGVATPAPVAPGAPPVGGSAYWGDWGELPGGQMASWATGLGYTPAQIIYAGQSTFPPAVEQWRPLVSQSFAPEDVNHALWILQHESGGINQMQQGGGPGTGLFQVENNTQHPGRPTAEQLLDPAFNVQYAANMAYGRGR